MKEIQGNLLDITEGIIVHGCNCRGVMGSGVAKAVRDKYPGVYKNYRFEFENYGLKLGKIQANAPKTLFDFVVDRGAYLCSELPAKLVVVNALTQETYGRDANVQYVSYEALEQCFAAVRRLALNTGLPVYFPKIGAGLGGGDWRIIEGIINAELRPDVDYTLVTLP